ncbi:hypothetical protein PAXRUDRAFT_158958 [Paxillus rubicundulus Ve08.2h10]|uniref:Unplaced genomic scaffold scaffold_1221, whole genome shotgun sequence n=1 Tax=Paxillus rubicundulus Ve08.2h10 TaxID=930991 RepID=A0A0D0CXM8_9AGAM|nr:hypothetical protein PAXRUDRAFT_158958 [Paxillus rubicundulus Ve08.2h10]
MSVSKLLKSSSVSSGCTLQHTLADVTIEHLAKEWTSPIYAFFDPIPLIVEINGHRAHDFECTQRGCNAKIRRYLDKRDATSTSNLRKHGKKCWGTDVVAAADDAKDAQEVRKNIVGGGLRDGTITVLFERQGKGKVTYSHRQHTRISDRGFQCLMKTGRPEHYIPSPPTVSRDVRLVFARTRQRVATMLQEYSGKVNFTTDVWTSPNHRAFIAFSVHLEHNGKPLSMLLDVIETATV